MEIALIQVVTLNKVATAMRQALNPSTVCCLKERARNSGLLRKKKIAASGLTSSRGIESLLERGKTSRGATTLTRRTPLIKVSDETRRKSSFRETHLLEEFMRPIGTLDCHSTMTLKELLDFVGE